MARIRFVGSDVDRVVTLDAGARARPTLLAVARAHGVPVLFNCERGSCGACFVEVTARAGRDRERIARRSEREAMVLRAMGRLSDGAGRRAGSPAAMPAAEPRLACQYRPEDEDIEVAFDNELGTL